MITERHFVSRTNHTGITEVVVAHRLLESALDTAAQETQQNRRRATRTAALFSLMYSGMDGGQMLIGDGMVTNLSKRGIGIRGNRLVQLGMDLSLFVDFPGVDEPLCIAQSRVLWTSGRRFGVELIKINLPEENQLRFFLAGQSA
jgi:PilZ domain